jgi:arginyl-tRNA synthetase
MLKTRAGDSVALSELLKEAVTRAGEANKDRLAMLPPDEQLRMAEAVGIGAVKYADLANDRVKDYVFDWNRMLAFEGNTGPYLMYAHARIRSILRKAADSGITPGPMSFSVPAERSLALALLQLPATIHRAAESLQPHRICTFVHEVATAFTGFYESCPILKSEEASRASRIALIEVTAQTLTLGLDLLGIAAPEQM